MRFSILGLIGGGLLGTVAGGLGSAFGTCLFIAGVWTLGWPRGWEAATVLAASLFPALGGFIGGTTAGACGRIGFLRPAIGGVSEPGCKAARWACSWRSRRITT